MYMYSLKTYYSYSIRTNILVNLGLCLIKTWWFSLAIAVFAHFFTNSVLEPMWEEELFHVFLLNQQNVWWLCLCCSVEWCFITYVSLLFNRPWNARTNNRLSLLKWRQRQCYLYTCDSFNGRCLLLIFYLQPSGFALCFMQIVPSINVTLKWLCVYCTFYLEQRP